MPLAMTMNMGKYRPGGMRRRLLQLSGDFFCLLLMSLENLEAGLQQALELGIASGRNERRLKCAIHSLMIRHLVGNISLIEGRAAKLRQFGALVGRRFGQGSAGVIVFRRNLEFRDEVERFFVHRRMVAYHALGKSTYVFVRRLR